MNLAQRKAYFELVGKILIADGVYTDDERAYLDSVAKRLDLTPEDQKSVTSSLNADGDIGDALAALDASVRAQLIADLREAAGADGKTSVVEEKLITLISAPS